MLKCGGSILPSRPSGHILNKLICDFMQREGRNTQSVAVMSSSSGNKFTLPDRYKGNEKSVWVEYIQLAAEYKPLNLGQGFPDFPPPEYVSKALAEATKNPNFLVHQYTRGFGHPRLVNALAALYSQMIGRKIDPMTEVLVTVGGYEALFSIISGHVNPGDEAIVIEPFFDCYDPMIRAAGGVPRFIPLKPMKTTGVVSAADWVLDKAELEGLFNEKTKLIIINTPQNPIGKVFTMEELEFIANLCKKWNVLCVSDEVYEWLVYKPKRHIRMASLPGMWERTLTVGSAGKTFSVTGWKIGWTYGPASLLQNAKIVHQNCVYTCSTPIQEALAEGFELELKRFGQPECYLNSLADELVPKMETAIKFIQNIGMVPTVPEGGYFAVANWTPLEGKVNLSSETDQYKDYKLTKWMTKNVGLLCIPTSAFYSTPHKHLGENYIRFCFIKKDENLKQAHDILEKWKARM